MFHNGWVDVIIIVEWGGFFILYFVCGAQVYFDVDFFFD